MSIEPNPLSEYLRKRTFTNTPEPGVDETGARTLSPNVYCVQRHHASRLYYDLRIEVGGTLKSWAVPQGPTLDPEPKRLAVLVEDHPLMYSTFEGNIPKGSYDAGSMMLWDSGTFEFIEYMDVGNQGGSAPSVDYQVIDGAGDIGVIASVTEPFCSSCTRARLTADGKLVTCLFSDRRP